MKFPVIVASAVLACKVFAAELSVTERDLPRVPATEPARAAETMQLREGLRLELVASEPLIADPVAMAFDESGRLYVVEMGDYSERRHERLGRVKLLVDTNGDGRFDKATVFADKLAWPTAVICHDGGVFVGASPDILYFKDTDGDGVADRRNLAFTGFGNAAARLNVQQLLNSFTWGVDNRIHGALGGNPGFITNASHPELKPLELRGRDFSFDPATLDLRAESGGGQWGLSFDDTGEKFVCSNARHLMAEMYEARFAARNTWHSMPPPDVNVGPDAPAAEIFRISPEEPWRVLRTKWRVAGLVAGPVEGGGRASGYFSGASAITIYRGDAFPEAFRGDVFVADCGSNLIHRKKLRREGFRFVAERAPGEERREFLASRDNWFRPVALANGPDGALYVVDMYRETVEHPWSLPPELKSRLDLNSGNDRGRIFRIVPEGFQRPKPVQLGRLTSAALVQTLQHPNGWHRDTAARLVCERAGEDAAPLLRDLLRAATNDVGRIHALHTLRSLGALGAEDVEMAARHSNAPVRVHAIRVAARLGTALAPHLESLAGDGDERVRFQLALVTSNSVTLTRLIQQDVEESWMRSAVLGGLGTGAGEVLAALAGDGAFNARPGADEFLREAARLAGAASPWNRVALALRVGARSPRALALAAAVAAGLEQRGMSLAAADRKPFDQLNEQALRVLRDTTAVDADRLDAVAFLSRAGDSRARAALFELLTARSAPAVQTAAITGLARGGAANWTNIFQRWPVLAPSTRSQAVALALSRREAAGAFAQALEQGVVARTELSAADVQRLRNHGDKTLQGTAQKVFQKDSSARGDVLKQFRAALEMKGDSERGRGIYDQRCAMCHRLGTSGVAVGPDLASAAAGGKEKLLGSILDPNAEVAAAFVAYTVDTRGGDTLLGLLAGEDAVAVTLKLQSGETMRVEREKIVRLRAGDRSLMPEGLEEGLKPQDMADLLEFLVRPPK